MIEMDAFLAALEATWPSAGRVRGPRWQVRIGQGGGSRVSAATAEGVLRPSDIGLVAAAQAALGQPALWMIRPGDEALDAALAARGYAVKDPVTAYAGNVAAMAATPPPPVTAFEVWPPLAVQAEIWGTGGIGPERLAVMTRVAGPKTTFLGRVDDRPAGTAFVAAAGDVAMVHALEVAPAFRRKGLARHLMAAAARWAAGQGATHLALAVTRANDGANALYTSLGMGPVGQYHYRILPE
ncbi:MAG: GNAT family N-acetyltransferase [Limimaricola sp.]|uniref:GNAT family N-acetyltransferase n=1 Tax=Limimaricola sp. TaxID=2211665 RepID=UPI001D7129FA|nr:GNAT family N-acetyltransferase [Limimaricola sp.]MBI1418757.1 GNAT family N-acetyltransferase [Limimaricola sp.]